jgi:predicted phage baseplate assembly protein
VMASQRRTLRDVAAGASRGTPDQVFTIPQIPILPGESLEVRELNGPRANVEWRILAGELFSDPRVIPALEEELRREGPQTDVVRGPLRLRRDRKKQVTEAWVHWESRPFLEFSRPEDRHYALDRALGRLFFGDGVNGKVPPQGAAILVRIMQSGGGARGNVAANTITQLLGVVPGVQAVFNPVRAEGGADGETADAIVTRGPATTSHRGRAVSAADYETLAREASPGVAYVRAIPNRNPAGRPLPGWLTLLIIPESEDARPYPSFGLRTLVRKFLESRAAADLAGRIHVTGPEYLPLDIDATIAPRLMSEAGIVEKAVRGALQRFLHPLRGGPSGAGWELGRDVYLSDIAAVLERVEGLDYVSELTMLLAGVPQGERVRVADDRIVVAGDIRLRVRAAEVEREEMR